MYIEILNEVVISYLTEEKAGKAQSINIHLTPYIYKTLLLEINDLISYKTDVPISFINISSIILHDRTITITCGEKLDSKFEHKIVEKLIVYTFNVK